MQHTYNTVDIIYLCVCLFNILSKINPQCPFNVCVCVFQQATFEAVSESIQIIIEDCVLIVDFIYL
jgi:hypothetical protein